MNQKILLIEIQTEDLPSRELKGIAQSFCRNLKKELKKNQISHTSISLFYTTTKIALKIFSLLYTPISKYIRKIGPLKDESFDENGRITALAQEWIKKSNISINKIEEIKIQKKKYLSFVNKKKSIPLNNLIIQIIPNAIKRIPFKKSMLWNNNSIRFSRPIRNIMILLNHKIISVNLPGITSHNISYGHFLMSPRKIIFNHANEYTEELFQKKYILINYKTRKKNILIQVKNLAESIDKKLYINKNLLREITLSVDWPKAYLGAFKKKYLTIPEDILIYIIESNQKYFPLYDKYTKKLTNNFILISNVDTLNSKKIIQENEQVLHSKLSNIIFFLNRDKKIKLSDRLILLKKISFHKNLGSIYDKTIRIKELSQYIAKNTHIDIQLLNRAAMLSKCDLTTNIVTEYPFLQGIIGMYYALINQENNVVALAIKEHYLPNFSTSSLPTQEISCVLSISEKIDTITGIFGIKTLTTQKKDPFALRRAAIGIIRIIIEKKIDINLEKLIIKSIKLHQHKKKIETVVEVILEFIYSKYISLNLKKKYNKKIISSVLSLKLTNLLDIDIRIQALYQFQKQNNIEKLLNIYKRINNILSQTEKQKKIIRLNALDPHLLEKSSLHEKKIIDLIKKINKKIIPSKKTNYLKVLNTIQKLCSPMENFFKNSLIYDKNITIRSHRVSILKKIQEIFMSIANFSYL